MWRREGRIYTFEPTLREIESLGVLFESITWIGFNHGDEPGANSRPTLNQSIRFELLPKAVGGQYWYHKLKIAVYLPYIFYVILRYLRKNNIVHTRGPSLPALLAILISVADGRRYFWHKYAGNWRHDKPPVAYRFQRWLLKKGREFVSVNGRAVEDKPNIHSFENPCFSESELDDARIKANIKKFEGKLNLLFVGRMELEKGSLNLLHAFKEINHFFTLTMIGDGRDMEQVKQFVLENELDVDLPGSLSREKINVAYSKAHLLILPTLSEGFPKVISEAAGFGCIPVVTSVSVIGEYIRNGENGFILENTRPESITKVLKMLPTADELKIISTQAGSLARLFTYERFIERIRNEFLESSTQEPE